MEQQGSTLPTSTGFQNRVCVLRMPFAPLPQVLLRDTHSLSVNMPGDTREPAFCLEMRIVKELTDMLKIIKAGN
jgi:hypothetical protein